jgi:hypothetical protein
MGEPNYKTAETKLLLVIQNTATDAAIQIVGFNGVILPARTTFPSTFFAIGVVVTYFSSFTVHLQLLTKNLIIKITSDENLIRKFSVEKCKYSGHFRSDL